LLVEDNPTDVFVIKELLAGYGPDLEVHLLTNGQAALLYLQELAGDEKAPCPALILLDLNLPKVTGVEVFRALRSNSRCSGIPVIIVTSSSADADLYAAQQLGAECYFRKPTELAAYMELTELIKRVLGDRKEP
jgi:two-component system, chemotaxis family, response regulator Rcp1